MREPVDMGVLASEAVAAFQARAASAGVSLAMEAPPDVPLADLDPLRLREVLTNLIANALRYTPLGGKITVAIEATAADQLAVSVRDTGAGIPPERLEHIFDRFYKSDESRGSGLGLAIVKSLVESHGGTLGVSSKPGEGTTFRFTLPIL
jgi:two-component system sensor histidine kinase BaeS